MLVLLQKSWCAKVLHGPLKVNVIQQSTRIFEDLNSELQNAMLHSEDFLSHFDLYSVDLAEISAREQLAIFNSADIVVGAHGAGMVSGLFKDGPL